jgi:hypothetical protein
VEEVSNYAIALAILVFAGVYATSNRYVTTAAGPGIVFVRDGWSGHIVTCDRHSIGTGYDRVRRAGYSDDKIKREISKHYEETRKADILDEVTEAILSHNNFIIICDDWRKQQ